MSEKIKLPKEVCNALDSLSKYNSNSEIIYRSFQQKWSDEFSVINNFNTDLLMRALVLGYESELTPEERIKELCSSVYNDPNSYFDKGFRFGVQRALELHGIHYDWLKS